MAEKQTTLVITARDDASVKFERVAGALSKMGERAGALNRGVLGRLGSGLSRLGAGLSRTWAGFSQVAYVASASAAIVGFTRDVRAAGDSVSELSRHYKLSTESLQVWGNLLTSSGGNAQNAAKGMQSLALSMEKAKSGDAELLYVFRQLGINLADLKTMSQQDVLGRMAQAFSDPKNTNELAKQAILVKTMGQDGSYFLDALSQGADVYRDKLADMKADGAVMSPEQLDTAREFERRWSSISTILSGIKMDFGLEAAKALLPLLERLQAFLRDPEQSKGLRESLRQIAQSLPAIGSAVMPIVRAVGTALSGLSRFVTWLHGTVGDVGLAAVAGVLAFGRVLVPVAGIAKTLVLLFGSLAGKTLVGIVSFISRADVLLLGLIGKVGSLFSRVVVIGRFLWPIVAGVGGLIAKTVALTVAVGKAALGFRLLGLPLAPVLGVVTAIGTAGYLLYQKWEPFRKLVDSIWEKLKGFTGKIGRWLGFGEADEENQPKKPSIGESAQALFARPETAPAMAVRSGYDPYAAARMIRQRDAHAEARVRVEVESKTGTRAVIRDVRKEGRVELNASQGMLMVGGD